MSQQGAEELASEIDKWLKKYHYSLNDDFMPYAVQKVREQVPLAFKVSRILMRRFHFRSSGRLFFSSLRV